VTPNVEYERFPIMDTAVANVSMAETLDIIDAFVAEGSPHVVVTANVDHLMLLRKDASFRRVYRRAELVTCDSVPLKWGLAFLGTPVKERVAGADLFPAVAARAARTPAVVVLVTAVVAALAAMAEDVPLVGVFRSQAVAVKGAGRRATPVGLFRVGPPRGHSGQATQPAGTVLNGPAERARASDKGSCLMEKSPPTLSQKLKAFALLSQCQAELAHELCRLMPETPRERPPRPERRRRGPRRRH